MHGCIHVSIRWLVVSRMGWQAIAIDVDDHLDCYMIEIEACFIISKLLGARLKPLELKLDQLTKSQKSRSLDIYKPAGVCMTALHVHAL